MPPGTGVPIAQVPPETTVNDASPVIEGAPSGPESCVPLFLSVMNCVAELPDATVVKAGGVVNESIEPVRPVPWRLVTPGPPGVALAVSVAARGPAAVGAKCTVAVQLPFGASVGFDKQLPPVTVNIDASLPPTVRLTAPLVDPPVLVTVTDWSSAPPLITTALNCTGDGVTDSEPGVTAVPDSAVDAVPPGVALRLIVAAGVPALVGCIVAVRVQLAPAASERPWQPSLAIAN